MNDKEIKEKVREKYNNLALQGRENEGCGCRKSRVYTIMSDSYRGLTGYNPDADMGLGCGLPTEIASISPGDTVIDLGSGAGNDCFVARMETGDRGRVIGIDFSPAMVAKAIANAAARGYGNVEFLLGDIECMPVEDGTADVVVSNCVLNLVPDKAAVFGEIHRVLKPGGHFSISDIVLTGVLPARIRPAAEAYAGCVATAIDKEEYLDHIRGAGFVNISVRKEKPIIVPDEILRQYIDPKETAAYKSIPTVIFSITVYGEKSKEAK